MKLRSAPARRLWRSTAPRCRKACKVRNCSDTPRARSPAPCETGRACLKRPTAARCFWTKWRSWSLRRKRSLLRALQEGVVTRLGEQKERKANARIIAATHRDLDAAIQTGAFRADLFFRLNVVNIAMPALREREHDVLLLAQQFIEEYRQKMNKPVMGLNPEVSRLFVEYDWPGNVRELRNALERAVLLSHDHWIRITDLPSCLIKRASARDDETPHSPANPSSQPPRKTEIIEALAKFGGNRDRAATLLGMSRTTLWRKMKGLGLIADG